MGGSFSCGPSFYRRMCRFSLLAFSSATQAGFWDRTTRKLSRKAIKRNEKIAPTISNRVFTTTTRLADPTMFVRNHSTSIAARIASGTPYD